jgi:hypothetical protein
MVKVPLAEHNYMVKTIASDRADQPLCICILPRRIRHDRPVPDAHEPKVREDLAIGAIQIANDIARRFLPAAGLGELTGDPLRVRVGCPSRISYLGVAMVQSGQNWRRYDCSGSLDRPMYRCVFGQPKVRAGFIIIG